MKGKVRVFALLAACLAVLAACVLWYAHSATLAARPEVRRTAQALIREGLLNRVERVDFYSGGPTFWVFTGTDDTGRRVFVWTQGEVWVYRRAADEGLSAEQAFSIARQASPAMARLIRAVPGLTEPGALRPGDPPGPGTERRVLWELFGTAEDGNHLYVYVDWTSGEIVRVYLLEG
ncbi:MAG: DUF5590 domain-containing protein [Alicyclobacillaceae bacterium]|nr:DUF5590 domain-containing protein [Alicyclobacillaceae bacterium]